MSYHSRKYSLDEDFFVSWTPQMAYVLGFWYADGNMRQEKSYRIRFYSKDSEHLAEIASMLSSESPVKLYRKHDSVLTVISKKMFHDLYSLGGRPAKSTTLTFPVVPTGFLRDFIRGYFDGDGSVHYIKYISTKNGKCYTNIRSNFTCGNRNFLEVLQQILYGKLALTKKKIGQYGPHQFKLGYGQKDTFRLLNFMYYDGRVGSLERKARYLELARAQHV